MKNFGFLSSIIIFMIAVGIIYTLGGILMPFIVSFILAYLFVPLANKLEQNVRLPRTLGSLLIIVIIICLFTTLWLFLAPMILKQIQLFIEQIPTYKLFIQHNIMPKIVNILTKIDPGYADKIQENINETFAMIVQFTINSINNIWKSGIAFINILSMLILVPFITFYLIKDWRKVKSGSKHLVPVKMQHKFQILISRMNRSLSGFIRGQINVCILLAIYYSIALSAIGINFGVFLGITTGILSFIPFVGLLSGLIASILVAYFQFLVFKPIIFIVVIFAVGSLIENIISPKLIGNKIGLHPVWIIFALLIGASFFGFIGMIFAIPCAAIINVICRFVFELYYSSKIYLGNETSEKSGD